MGSKRRPREVPARFEAGFLDGLDQRFAPAIAAKRTYADLVIALGGDDSLSPQRRMLVERIVWLHLVLQRAEREFVLTGKLGDDHVYSQRIHALTSLLKTIGLERVARDVPSLREYLKESSNGAK